MEDLVKYLLKYAFDHGISCALIRREQSYQSVALPDKKLIVINQNSKNKFELPFIIGHEIGHIMNGNVNGAFYCGKPVNSEERKADLYSLNLIYKYASSQFETFDEPGIFMEQFGIPYRMKGDVYRLFKENDDLVF
ncbi:putative prophage repressor [Lactobacillus kullabergensis]|uniref:Putative prophage repressor n=1 Tax=Lactobacillus kullabergensis TaxID=1218493 RepID=A0A0F4LBA2_9LACO|nr:hypothetical protein [Lactobacillus kullabergensis]KJY56117.1 putative prophage repressor [Lactobacillus kullabergensis]